MRIALNWFEVSLPSAELLVGVEIIPIQPQGESPQRSTFSHLVVQRRSDSEVRLLHATDTPPPTAILERLSAIENATFVKRVIEDAFAQLLHAKGFAVFRQHVGAKAYMTTEESLWPDIYSFLRGISFRGFYFRSQTAGRWGLVLNYITSQRFRLSLEDHHLQAMALGKKVVPFSMTLDGGDVDRPRSGSFIRADGQNAVIDTGGDTPLTAPLSDWTLPCRRELLHAFIYQTRGPKEAGELMRRLQQATFALTESGRMNTLLAKDQLRAVQQLLRDYDLLQFPLPLPSSPPVSLSVRAMEVPV